MKIAFVGFRHGHIWSLYNSAVESTDIEIAGRYEEDDVARVVAEEITGKGFEFNSYDEILDDTSIEIIAIGDYYSKRGNLIIEALKSGKHVICDKPICTDVNELDEIEFLSKEKGLKVLCLLDLRYMDQVKVVKELIQDNVIGKVHNVSFTGQHFLNYGNRPNWYFEDGKHGGTINDIAIHGVDLLRYLLNKDFTETCFAKMWNAFATEKPDFMDCAQFIAKMGDITVNADVSYAAPSYNRLPTYWRFELWGSKGLITFCANEDKVYIYTDEKKVIECNNGKPEYIRDMILECNGTETILSRNNILESQRQVLKIQMATV